MNTGSIEICQWSAQRNPEVAPEWAPTCERWYQLDAAAYSLTDAFANLLKFSELPNLPIFLSCPQSSNISDLNFVESGAISPALFVHTLPNVRLSSALQITQSHNPFFCLLFDRDPTTQALRETLFHVSQTQAPALLIDCSENRQSGCQLTLFMAYPPRTTKSLFSKNPDKKILWNRDPSTQKSSSDLEFFDFWQNPKAKTFAQLQGFALSEES